MTKTDDLLNELIEKTTWQNKLLEESILLQRFDLLGPDRVMRFVYRGEEVALKLPNGDRDFVQRTILKTNGFYEMAQLEKLRELNLVGPDSVVCDVGANIGNHSVFFGRGLGVSHVASFEPQGHCFATLRENLRLNGMDPDAARQMVLSEADGRAEVRTFKPRNLGGTQFQPVEEGGVQMSSLDAALSAEEFSATDLVKIDVEGMQMDVLRGMTNLMVEQKPSLWVELLTHEEIAEASEYLAVFGYTPKALSKTDHLFVIN